jgi:predicted HicB family RNase H-like nuclease
VGKKDLKYYLSLPYAIEVRQLREDEGGGYLACIPLLGRSAVLADGLDVEEALKNLELVKKDVIREWLARGIVVPEPISEDEYSGKFVVRVPRYLHKHYADVARESDISLNTAIVIALEKNAKEEHVCQWLDEKLAQYISPVRDKLDRLLKMQTFELQEGMGKNAVVPIDWAA